MDDRAVCNAVCREQKKLYLLKKVTNNISCKIWWYVYITNRVHELVLQDVTFCSVCKVTLVIT